MKLNDITCKKAKGKDKPYKLSDGRGLFLHIHPNNSKYWRYKYRINGKEKLLSLGVYGEVSLKEAREEHNRAHKLVSQGIDPSQDKKLQKQERLSNAENTFEAIAREWHETKKTEWSEKYASTIMNRLEADIFGEIGSLPMKDITVPILVNMLRSIESRGVYETTRRASQYCKQIFHYAVSSGKIDTDITATLKGTFKTKKTKHHNAITIQELPDLLKELETNKARMYEPTRLAVRLMLLTFVRTSELIQARWDEFDFDDAMWTIPAERMKMSKGHLVPLSKQAIAILKELQKFNGNREWVFASHTKPRTHMSNNTILAALYRMGYKGRMTGHGFRALALTAIQEKLGYPFEVADLQLAHAKRHSLGEAYDRAQFLDRRKTMMQDWSDFIDKLG